MIAPVQFQAVGKVYCSPLGRRQIRALTDVSFAVEAGEVFGLVGPNRAGKTTILKILLSVCKPSAGTVVRFGQPLQDRAALGRIGYMHEKQAFPGYLTARQLLHFYGSMSGVTSTKLHMIVPGLLERVGLKDRCHEPISRFSKGMLQRLALAQSLINEPDLLVLDEPTEGLDITGRRLIRDVVQAQKAAGKSTILVSHSLQDIEQLCDRLAVLREGALLFLGAPEELVRRHGGVVTFAEALERLYEGSPT